ncbi:hypothetical protein ACJX0J_022734, partial [Zea mays]
MYVCIYVCTFFFDGIFFNFICLVIFCFVQTFPNVFNNKKKKRIALACFIEPWLLKNLEKIGPCIYIYSALALVLLF